MLNLHSIANPLIANLHPNEAVTIYQSIGQTNTRGKITPIYASGEAVEMQIQGGDENLTQTNDVNQTSVVRKAYLFADMSSELIPRSLHRSLARTGDYICRADGTWWLVTALLEDFSKSGWVSVNMTEQLKSPDFSACEWYSETEEEEEESTETSDETSSDEA